MHHRFSHDVLIGGNVPTSHARGYMIASDLVLQEVRAIRLARSYVGTDFSYFRSATDSAASQTVRFPSVDAPFQARENVGVVVARGRMLSSVRPLMRQEDSRRPVWEFADRVQITQSVLEALWKALVVPAPSRRLLRHTLLPLALTSSRSWSAYAATAGVR